MPYAGKWVPAVLAIAHVVQVDRCDRVVAMHQIEAAVRDRALRWVRGGSNRWSWDAEVSRADLFKLWPKHQAASKSTEASKAALTKDTLADPTSEERLWFEQPLPPIAELRHLNELIAEFWNTVRPEIRSREKNHIRGEVNDRSRAAAVEDVTTEALGWLRQGALAAFLDTVQGLEVLPYGSYWQDADGNATSLAQQALNSGTVPSRRYSDLAGEVKVRKADFDALVNECLSDRGFAIGNPGAGRFVHPVWDLRDVFGWVLDRNPARFGRIKSETDWRSAAWAARFYTDMPRIEFDRFADQTLLHALQRGELTGYNGTSAIPKAFWIDKTILTLRRYAANFYREEVLALWPDLRRIGRDARTVVQRERPVDRSPPWHIWKNVPQIHVFEAVALSLNIDPRKLHHNPQSWMAEKRLFDEGQEFNDRLFLAERSAADIGVIHPIASQYEGYEPTFRLDSFVRWALKIGWTLPAELLEAPVLQSAGSPPADHARHFGAAPTTFAPAKPPTPGRSGRKRGSGSLDDKEHLRAMFRLLANGQAASVYAAAQQVANTITQSRQSREADINRLRRKFAKQYGTEPLEGESWADIESKLNTN